MGLDQYAGTVDEKGNEMVLAEWRKHNRLQGWMEDLFISKTKKPKDELNCQKIYLTKEDVDKLASDIQNKNLPQTSGFFYGNDSYERYETLQTNDEIFIERAKEALSEGLKVYYTCWW